MENTEVVTIKFEIIFGDECICGRIVYIAKEIHKARNLSIVR